MKAKIRMAHKDDDIQRATWYPATVSLKDNVIRIESTELNIFLSGNQAKSANEYVAYNVDDTCIVKFMRTERGLQGWYDNGDDQGSVEIVITPND